MTRPIPACQACKQRKMKCGGEGPPCQNCSRSHRVCLPASTGGPGTKELTILSENEYAADKTARRPRGPRSSFTQPSGTVDLESRAVAYYIQFHLHITSGKNFAGGWSECISHWLSSERSSHVVDLAFSALALATYGRTQNDPQASKQASQKYIELLQLVQEMVIRINIQSLNKSDVDSYLLTIFLLSRYESVIFHPSTASPRGTFDSLRSWSHHDGALAILQIWYEMPDRPPPSIIVRQNRRGCLKSHLLRNKPLPPWLEDGEEFGESGLSLEYDRILTRLMCFHYAVHTLDPSASLTTVDIERFDRNAILIYAALEAWAKNIPSQPLHGSINKAGPYPRRHFFSDTVLAFSDPSDAGFYAQYLATTLLANNTHYKVLKHLSFDPAIHEELLNRNPKIKQYAEDLATLIPFCLQRVTLAPPSTSTLTSSSTSNPSVSPPGLEQEAIHLIPSPYKTPVKPYTAGLVVWPLTIASSLEAVSEEHKAWFRSELVELGRICGDGALEAAEGREWVRL